MSPLSVGGYKRERVPSRVGSEPTLPWPHSLHTQQLLGMSSGTPPRPRVHPRPSGCPLPPGHPMRQYCSLGHITLYPMLPTGACAHLGLSPAYGPARVPCHFPRVPLSHPHPPAPSTLHTCALSAAGPGAPLPLPAGQRAGLGASSCGQRGEWQRGSLGPRATSQLGARGRATCHQAKMLQGRLQATFPGTHCSQAGEERRCPRSS